MPDNQDLQNDPQIIQAKQRALAILKQGAGSQPQVGQPFPQNPDTQQMSPGQVQAAQMQQAASAQNTPPAAPSTAPQLNPNPGQGQPGQQALTPEQQAQMLRMMAGNAQNTPPSQ